MKLLIGTANENKVQEIILGLGDVPYKLISLSQLPSFKEEVKINETGKTYMENASAKAREYAKLFNMLTLAEDSGIEIDILDGKPGVYSKRFTQGTDKDRYEKILERLRMVPREKRTARYRCAIAIYNPKTDMLKRCEASCTGVIASVPKGKRGFGYDPIFYLPALDKTMAELTLKQKNLMSHRGRALARARVMLKEFV